MVAIQQNQVSKQGQGQTSGSPLSKEQSPKVLSALALLAIKLTDFPLQASVDAPKQLVRVIKHLRGTQFGSGVKGDLPQKFLNYH